MLYENFLERFNNFNKIIQLIDKKIGGRCKLETKPMSDYEMRVKFQYKPSEWEDDNCIITLAIAKDGIKCWYDLLRSVDNIALINFFMNFRCALTDLWCTNNILFDDFKIDEEKIDLVTKEVNKLLDLWETGMKIREKMQKQMEINISKFTFAEEK